MPALDLNKRRQSIKFYASLGNATEAAKRAGVPAKSAHAVAYRWLRNPDIIALLRDELDTHIRELGPLAVSVVRDIMLDLDAPPQTRLTAARDVMDRLGWLPPKRADAAPVHRTINQLTREELEEIAARGRDEGRGVSAYTHLPQKSHLGCACFIFFMKASTATQSPA